MCQNPDGIKYYWKHDKKVRAILDKRLHFSPTNYGRMSAIVGTQILKNIFFSILMTYVES